MSRLRPEPLVIRVPDGAGPRWTVLDVTVEGDVANLCEINRRDGYADETQDEAWSPIADAL